MSFNVHHDNFEISLGVKTKHKLFIVGAGGFGREVFSWVKDCCEWNTKWDFGGFLDDDSNALNGLPSYPSVASSISDYEPKGNHRLLGGIADPKSKLRIYPELINRGAVFESMIHPSATIGRDVSLGVGAVICPYSVITCNVNIGDHVSMNLHASIGHDAIVGDYCHMNSHSEITGNCLIRRGVIFGSHAFILPGRSVGEFAKVGAGSVAIRSIPKGTSVFGNPARSI
jgi:sugar O-acyltransferase (sialic acid O-acetyltransferase NeuD family)